MLYYLGDLQLMLKTNQCWWKWPQSRLNREIIHPRTYWYLSHVLVLQHHYYFTPPHARLEYAISTELCIHRTYNELIIISRLHAEAVLKMIWVRILTQ